MAAPPLPIPCPCPLLPRAEFCLGRVAGMSTTQFVAEKGTENPTKHGCVRPLNVCGRPVGVCRLLARIGVRDGPDPFV